MGRIALFVVVVGGATYFVIEWVAGRLFDARPSPLVAASIAVLVAVVLWTALIWRFGERLGRERDDTEG